MGHHGKQHGKPTTTADGPKVPRKVIIIVVAAIAVLIGSFKAFLFLTEFRDARIAPLQQAMRTLHITSVLRGNSMPAEEVVTLVPTTAVDGGVFLGTKKKIKKDDVLLSYPRESFIEGTNNNTVAGYIVKSPELEKLNLPRLAIGLAMQVLVEKLKGPASPYAAWFEAVRLSHDDKNLQGAFQWPAEAADCVADFFKRDVADAHSLPRMLREALQVTCADGDFKDDFLTEYDLICDEEDNSGSAVPKKSTTSDADLIAALNVVGQRGMMNQAILPLLDFCEVSADSNVNFRWNRGANTLDIYAVEDIPAGAPFRFQRYLGRYDGFMRTGKVYHGLNLEAIFGRFSDESPEVAKLCHDKSSSLVFSPDGQIHQSLSECIALFAAKNKKQRAQIAKNPTRVLAGDKQLRLNVATNISYITNEKILQLKAAVTTDSRCARFEPLRTMMLDVFEKAVANLDSMKDQ